MTTRQCGVVVEYVIGRVRGTRKFFVARYDVTGNVVPHSKVLFDDEQTADAAWRTLNGALSEVLV